MSKASATYAIAAKLWLSSAGVGVPSAAPTTTKYDIDTSGLPAVTWTGRETTLSPEASMMWMSTPSLPALVATKLAVTVPSGIVRSGAFWMPSQFAGGDLSPQYLVSKASGATVLPLFSLPAGALNQTSASWTMLSNRSLASSVIVTLSVVPAAMVQIAS